MTADYHLHTSLCRHASGVPVDYARAALAAGIPEIGFADHNPMPGEFDDWRMRLDELPLYLEWVNDARSKYPELNIRLGLECDYIADHENWITRLAEMAPWDYLIGSVHYIAPGWDVDNPRWIGRFEERSVHEIWSLYWIAYERCIRSGMFDLVAHPDLPKKFGHRPEGDLRKYYEPVIQAAVDADVAIEINTAGLRKPVHEMYPSEEFLSLAFAAGIPLVISSDAHAPEDVGADFSMAIALARKVGYTRTARFAGRRRSFTAL
jgi:histidinol-phosphatase (PHP family)